MQTKNQISLIRKSLYGFMLLGIFFFTFGIGNFPTVRAQEATTQTLTAQTKVILSETPFISAEVQESKLEVTSTIPIPAEISASVVETLRSRPANILPGNKIIITSLDQNSGWALMTVAVQLENPNPEESILLNSAVVIAKSDSSGWTSAIMGTDAYEVLLTEVPAALVPAESKAFLSTIAVDSPNSLGSLAIGTSLRWPWASNARWTMTQKPHSWYGAGAGTDTS
ncbi:hypothetical protein JZU68_06020, partial [bacterium]|nr:hypothetical protein [bacterium]